MRVNNRWKRVFGWISLGLLALLLVAAGLLYYYFGPFPMRWGALPDTPAPAANWPWPGAVQDTPHAGVTHWIDRTSPDGTMVELFDFDFLANPHLRLELYDQDEDDETPGDDKARFWPNGVGQVTRHLNTSGRGQVLAAWNGLFFQYDGHTRERIGRHVAPVVLQGQVRYNVGTVRWAFGVKYRQGKPFFAGLHQPNREALIRAYDFAAVGASCLIRDGKPLRLQPFPKPGENALLPSQPSTPQDSGFVRLVDHIRTSRTSMGWSRDNRHFYLLIVKEPDSEPASIYALQHRIPLQGGWTVADLQRFWQAFGAWGAVNIDGGNVTQMTCLQPDGRYDMVPPRWADRAMRRTFSADFPDAPTGGTMMYFYIRDARQAKP